MNRFGEHWINVTAGIGMEGHHAPRIRFQCPPEVTLIRVGGGQDSVSPPPGKE
jgi:predicted MPP superfamily phosphohydrolase